MQFFLEVLSFATIFTNLKTKKITPIIHYVTRDNYKRFYIYN